MKWTLFSIVLGMSTLVCSWVFVCDLERGEAQALRESRSVGVPSSTRVITTEVTAPSTGGEPAHDAALGIAAPKVEPQSLLDAELRGIRSPALFEPPMPADREPSSDGAQPVDFRVFSRAGPMQWVKPPIEPQISP